MEVGVRTRARAPAMEDASKSRTAKRRKVAGDEFSLSPSLVRLRRNLRPRKVTIANSASPETSISKDQCSSNISDQVMTSCCSSNASTDCGDGRFELSDPEEECVEIEESKRVDFNCRDRRETTTAEVEAESGEVESMARPSEVSSRRRSEKMPSESEIEEFFVAAEKDLHKRFAENYNYDIVKDAPLVGRYEWVQTKP